MSTKAAEPNRSVRPFQELGKIEFTSPSRVDVQNVERRAEELARRKTTKLVRCIAVEEKAGPSAGGERWAMLATLLEEVVESKGTVFAHEERRYGICLFGDEEEMSDKSMQAFASFLTSYIRKSSALQVNIGIGAIVHTYGEMSRSISSAIRALEAPSYAYGDASTVWMHVGACEGMELLEGVKRLVDATYAEATCSLKRIAKEMFVNAAYLGRMFKEKEGISFKDYLNGVRMAKAKALLTGSDMRVYEIARAVGYREVDWFYKKFKACTGMSTQEFREFHKYNL